MSASTNRPSPASSEPMDDPADGRALEHANASGVPDLTAVVALVVVGALRALRTRAHGPSWPRRPV